MTTALLIIDVQAGLSAGKYAAFEVDRMIDRINGVSARLRQAGAPVVLIQHEEDEGLLVHGSAPWQLAAALDTAPGDLRLRKTACDSFHKTALQELLQARGVTELIACGLQSEFCVDSTVRGALSRGYPVTLISDGHSTLDSGALSAAQIIAHHNETLSNISSYGPRVRLRRAQELPHA
jgi:nicotinamidase-related amidase